MKHIVGLLATIIFIFLVSFFVASQITAPKLTIGIPNPDLIFERTTSCFNSQEWKGDAICYAGTIDGDPGNILTIPYPHSGSRFVYSTFIVPKNAKTLELKVKNIAGSFWDPISCNNCKTGIAIVIKDLDGPLREIYPVDSFEISPSDGWVRKTYDLTDLASILGHRISLIIYAYKPSGISRSPWIAIGYINLK